MVMRVGGLASGMDLEAIVNKLMEAERMPLKRLRQDQSRLVWKQEAFREMNRALFELDQMMLEMKLSPTYQSKIVHSSNPSAVEATASPSAANGVYDLSVSSLATNAINIGKNIRLAPDQPLNLVDPIVFFTYDEEGEEVRHEIEVDESNTLSQVLKKITDHKASPVRAFYDENTNQVVLETTRTGKYNISNRRNGKEIEFEENSFFTNILNLDPANEQGGNNATFVYNNVLTLESKTNSYTLNGVNFEFKNRTSESVRLVVNTDIDHTVETIKKFVEKYNEVIDLLNRSQQEQRHRDFPPLTEEQKKEMTDEQIKQWEEKAKSGILRGETAITGGMYDLRKSWYESVDTGGAYKVITEIGLKTSNKYMDGGKLEIDEQKLRDALLKNPDDVRKLFSNANDDNSRGLINRLEDAVKKTMSKIEETAGRSSYTLENYSLGRRMKDINEQIARMEARMVRIESKYWSQFTQMEKAIQRMNDQSAMIFSQFMDM